MTLARLDEHDGDFAGVWRPEAGDKIVGVFERHDRREGYNGKPYTVLTLRLDDGTRASVHAFYAVLQDEPREQSPKISDVIGIRYYGEKAKPCGGRYYRYRVGVDRADASPDMTYPDGDRGELADRYREGAPF